MTTGRTIFAATVFLFVFLLLILLLFFGSWFTERKDIWNIYVGIAGTFILGFIALFKDWFIELFDRPNISYQGFHSIEQGDFIVTRIIYKNVGSRAAESVQAIVDEIIDPNGVERKIVPLPLNWMHNQLKNIGDISEKVRINKEQPAYLDLTNLIVRGRDIPTQKIVDLDAPVLRLASLIGSDNPEWSHFVEGSTQLVIHLYATTGQLAETRLRLTWTGGSTAPHIEEITKIKKER